MIRIQQKWDVEKIVCIPVTSGDHKVHRMPLDINMTGSNAV